MSIGTKALLSTAVLLACSINAHAANVNSQAVNNACRTDADATGCVQEVGKGFQKCTRNYKVAHKDFKLSDGCREAMKQMKQAEK